MYINRHYLQIFLTGICLFFSLNMLAATYPVQVNVVAIPPNSMYLNDYYSGTSEKLSVTLLNRDTQQPQIKVKLRLTIWTTSGLVMTTKPEAWFDVIYLEAGVPLRLSMQELSAYFLPKNLNIQGNLINEMLPEGRCEFRFDALDYATGRVLSTTSLAAVYLQLLQPPILQQPVNKQKAIFKEPLNLLFSWSPCSSVFGSVGYEFTLKQIKDTTADVNAAFLYSQTIYKGTTSSTLFPYTPDLPLLEPHNRYAWQVKSSIPNDIANQNRFQNNGYSTVSYFDLFEDCRAPVGVNAYTNKGCIYLWWSPAIGATRYSIQYRRKDSSDNLWYEKFVNGTSVILSDITAGYDYDYQVGTVCLDSTVVYGIPSSIHVPASGDPASATKCGMKANVDISNTKKKASLSVGDVILAGDFPVKLTKVSGSNGIFTGEGSVTVPYLGVFPLAVTFNGIGVSEENRLISGVIETKYDESASGISDLNSLTEGGVTSLDVGVLQPDITVGFTMPDNPVAKYDASTNKMMFTDANGNSNTIDMPVDEDGNAISPFVLKDANNSLYKVDQQADGTYSVTKLGQQEAPIADGSINETLLDADKAIVTFQNAPNSAYTLDNFLTYYDDVSIIRYNSNMGDDRLYPQLAQGYYLKWKFIPEGKTDQITAKVDIKNPAKIVDPNKIIFKSKTGTVFTKSDYNSTDQTFTVTLSGTQADSKQQIFALYPSDVEGQFWNLGELYTDSRTPQTFKVILVNLGGTYTVTDISTQLNQIYNPLGITWEVEDSNSGFTCGADTLQSLFDKGSGLLSAYNDNMKAINNRLIATLGDKYDKTACYVFMMDDSNAGNGRDVAGFMPRGRQFAYIYTSKLNPLATGIAHELAHGKFKLSHTFDTCYGTNRKIGENPDNLMDYSNGSHIAKWQWDEIYSPAILNGIFDTDAEGMEQTSRSQIVDKVKELSKKFGKLYIVIHRYELPPDNSKNQQTISFSTNTDLNTPLAQYITTENNIRNNIIVFKVNDAGGVDVDSKLNADNQSLLLNSLSNELNISSDKFLPLIVLGENTNINIDCSNYTTGLQDLSEKAINSGLEGNYLNYYNAILSSIKDCSKPQYILLMVNGYRFGLNLLGEEKPLSNNEILGSADAVNSEEQLYWNGLDNSFSTRLKSNFIFYADGHDFISTSNHKDMLTFGISYHSILSYFTPPSIAPDGSRIENDCYNVPSCIILDTTPNRDGFEARRTRGKAAATEFLLSLKNENIRKNIKGQIIDTLDIVCHSMGYAYALGVIDVLKDSIPFGRFYIIAPENAGSGGVDFFTIFKDVWQYGSDEVKEPKWLQDGVAPQVGASGLPTGKRAYYPTDGSVPRGFLQSHSIQNYKWIFNNLQNKDDKGYIKPRE